ncbi:MAG: phosphoenolpyruvate--protein phosphotransferase [Candidatus Improbicoccus pseudotrichonymphae]|uniref:Phosphoenolpyruvate-protein phosphotransferase n=1 Tax=Candidatus Improbicoccus pseudotrichonymphae TaxID=3033792 RepID=A0AA48IH37_9FIRM|nr:MAG: phosphoenolpyruvate--protein phosphotransferase [Candidatus Improbicoccus pseudotrichonymphae]
MRILKGKGISKGIAFGVLRAFKRDYFEIYSEKKYTFNHDEEIEKFKVAKEIALGQLEKLYQEALDDLGEEYALVFNAHKMIIEDIEYINSIINIIKNENANIEYAIWRTSRNFEFSFEKMESEYMQQRAADIRDISKRIISCLDEETEQKINANRKNIIIGADDLSPSEILEFDKKIIKGFITMLGSENSHTAILARAMNLTSVIGLGDQLRPEFEGCEVIIDSFAGAVYVSPDKTTIRRLKKKKELCDKNQELLKSFKGKEDITLDGQKIELCANISNIADLGAVIENDAKGVGLFRSEFIFMGRSDYPSEEEQFRIYKRAAQKMGDKKCVIRTIDIGADKQIKYFNLPREVNPAIGYRAIRICLDRPIIFKAQLRAILRASEFGNINILFPMIISLDEILQIKCILKECKEELDNIGCKYKKDIKVGIMIETPAAVMISDILAKEVDFFNIGTNDLTQYSLAIDRQNDKVNFLYNPKHKAILRMIKIICENAKKYNKKVCICGELATDESLLETLLSLGVDELSMSAPFILNIRKYIRKIDVGKVKNEILLGLED